MPHPRVALPVLVRSLCRSLVVDVWQETDARWAGNRQAELRRVPGIAILLCAILAANNYFGRTHLIGLAFPSFAAGPYRQLAPLLDWVSFVALTYALAPALYARLALGIPLRELGLGLGTTLKSWGWYAGLYLLNLPGIYWASRSAAFTALYPFYRLAGRSGLDFLLWEAAYIFQFACVEFLFRGFLVHTLKRSLGAAAVPVMVIPYAMIHFHKPLAETGLSIIMGFLLGFLSLKCRSIWGGVALHAAVAVSMDALALAAKAKGF